MSSSSSDAKLVHLVKKFLSFSVDESPNADHIVHCLRTQHREYRRKDLTKLKRQVHKLLKKLSKSDEDGEGVTPSSSSSKKRSLEAQAEERYEKKARKHDSERSSQLNDSSVLNAALIERYRKLQQERDDDARAEAEETIPHGEDVDGKSSKKESSSSKSRRKSRESTGSSKHHKPERELLVKTSSSKSLKHKSLSSSSSKPGKHSKSHVKSPNILALENRDNSRPNEAVARPTERYADLGGMKEVMEQIRQLVEYPLVRPELYRHLGVDPPRGVLLRGPPGCGKTHLANAIAGQLGVPYFRVSAPELVSGMSGESEARIRELFQAASDSAPAIVFLDELDAIAPKRSDGGSSRGMEKRMVAQLLTCLDMLHPKYNRQEASVIVLGATNRSDSIDSALRRAGRFDKEILIGVPDEDARIGILKTMTRNMKLSGGFDFKVLARRTPGYVGADIRSLTKEAAVVAINRIFKDVLKDQKLPSALVANDNEGDNHQTAMESITAITPLSKEEMEPLHVTMDDFLAAIPHVQPSSKREGFATVPDVSWDDIGALGSIREELTLSVLEPIRNPEKFKSLGIPLPAGVMLYGPPGCGKTLLAKAIANESGCNFISVKGPELLDKYVGESERSVRLVFERARSSSPCVVFFDELDSLCPKRGSDGGGGGGVSERVVNQLLTEMDGLESRRSVFVIAATNRPELIDPAMMRPGRLDKLLYVPLPTPDDRVSILTALATNIKLGPDVDLDKIGRSPRAEGYSGADCAALLREAGLAVLKEDVNNTNSNSNQNNGNESSAVAAGQGDDDNTKKNDEATVPLWIQHRHFDYAFHHVVPSVSTKDQARYNRMRDRMAHARSRGAVVAEPVEEPDEVVAGAGAASGTITATAPAATASKNVDNDENKASDNSNSENSTIKEEDRAGDKKKQMATV